MADYPEDLGERVAALQSALNELARDIRPREPTIKDVARKIDGQAADLTSLGSRMETMSDTIERISKKAGETSYRFDDLEEGMIIILVVCWVLFTLFVYHITSGFKRCTRFSTSTAHAPRRIQMTSAGSRHDPVTIIPR
jgi:hypothetical protein